MTRYKGTQRVKSRMVSDDEGSESKFLERRLLLGSFTIVTYSEVYTERRVIFVTDLLEFIDISNLRVYG